MKEAYSGDSEDQALERIQVLALEIRQRCGAEDFEAAIRLLREQAAIFEALGDLLSLAKNYEQQADIEDNHTGDMEQSGWLREQAEILKYQAGDKATVAARLGVMALLQKVTGRQDAAQEMLKQQEFYLRELKDHIGLATCLKNQTELLFESGNSAFALKLIVEAEQLIYKYGDGYEFIRICRILSLKAMILEENDDLDGALVILKEVQQLAAAQESRVLVAENLASQAQIYYKLGQTAMAIQLFTESVDGIRDIGTAFMLPDILDRHAQMRLEIGDLDAALNLQRDAEQFAVRWRNGFQIKSSLYGQAEICLRMGNREEAMELCDRGKNYPYDGIIPWADDQKLRDRFGELLAIFGFQFP